MCDRIGCTHFPDLSKMNFGGAVAPSRRGFLKGAAAVSTKKARIQMDMPSLKIIPRKMHDENGIPFANRPDAVILPA